MGDENMKRVFYLTLTKSYEQSTSRCDICCEIDFLSKCYRCTIVICSTCVKKMKNECPMCKLYPSIYVCTNVKILAEVTEAFAEDQRVEEEKKKVVVATTKRHDLNSLISDIQEFGKIKNIYVNFDIKTICEIMNTKY